MKKLLIFLIVLFTTGILVYAGLLIFGVFSYNNASGWGYGHHHGFGFTGLGMGLFWLLVIVGLLYFLEQPERKHTDRALDTLNERYARGEIDTETYRQIKHTLEEN